MRAPILLSILILTSCTGTPAAAPPPDAPTCDVVSCGAGAALECCTTLRTAVRSALDGVVSSGWAPDFGGFGGASRGCLRATDFGGRFVLPVELEHGDRMMAMSIEVAGDASSDLDVAALSFETLAETISVLGKRSITNAASGWHIYALDLDDTTVGDGAWQWIEVAADQPGACVGPVRLTYDRPAVATY